VKWPLDNDRGGALSVEEEIVARDIFGRLPDDPNYRFFGSDSMADEFKGPKVITFSLSKADSEITFSNTEESMVTDYFGRLPDNPNYNFFGTDNQARELRESF
jgi:hypothetical protein